MAGHLEDAAVDHRRGVKGLKVLARWIWERDLLKGSLLH